MLQIIYHGVEDSKMRLLSRLPGFVTILIIGLAIIAYGATLPELDPNWVIAIGLVFIVIAILAITVVR
jgi:hypothetical protein